MKYSQLGFIAIVIIVGVLLLLPRAEVLQESQEAIGVKIFISKLGLAYEEYERDFLENPPLEAKKLASTLTGNNPKGIIYLNSKETLLENEKFVDPWHTPFQYSKNGSSDFIIRSAGKDRKFYTEDDYVNE